jgi:hypothetical protein
MKKMKAASATILLLFDVMRQAFQVHLGKTEALPHPMMSLGVYIGFATVGGCGIISEIQNEAIPTKTSTRQANAS